jgi:hypothetical protein
VVDAAYKYVDAYEMSRLMEVNFNLTILLHFALDIAVHFNESDL